MTGTNDNRPDFRRMIRDSAKKSWDFILVYKLDRFSRNKYETAIHKKTLKDNGVKVLSAMENIPETPEGIILESLLEGMNQYFSAELSQKIRRGMRETRLKGKGFGVLGSPWEDPDNIRAHIRTACKYKTGILLTTWNATHPFIARLMQAADGMCRGSSDLTYAESMALSGNLLRKISVGTQDPGAAWLGTRTLF